VCGSSARHTHTGDDGAAERVPPPRETKHCTRSPHAFGAQSTHLHPISCEFAAPPSGRIPAWQQAVARGVAADVSADGAAGHAEVPRDDIVRLMEKQTSETTRARRSTLYGRIARAHQRGVRRRHRARPFRERREPESALVPNGQPAPTAARANAPQRRRARARPPARPPARRRELDCASEKSDQSRDTRVTARPPPSAVYRAPPRFEFLGRSRTGGVLTAY